MRLRKILKWTLVVVAVGSLLAVVVLYILASRIPSQYHPVQLAQDQREEASREFLRKLQDFGNASQRNAGFSWSISQDQLNSYLASMDEIAAIIPADEPVIVTQQLASVGVGQPVVHLDDGILTVMVSVAGNSKVLSFDLSFEFTAAGLLQVRLAEARVGNLPIPSALWPPP